MDTLSGVKISNGHSQWSEDYFYNDTLSGVPFKFYMNTLSGVKDRFLLDTLSAVRSGGILKKIWIYSVI